MMKHCARVFLIAILLLLGSCAAQAPVKPNATPQASASACEIDPVAVCSEGYALWRKLTPSSEQNSLTYGSSEGWNWSTEMRFPTGGSVMVGCEARIAPPTNINGSLASPAALSKPDRDYLRRNNLCRGASASVAPVVKPQTSESACGVDATALCRRFYSACWQRSQLASGRVPAFAQPQSAFYWSNQIQLPAGSEIGLLCSGTVVPHGSFRGIASEQSPLARADLGYLRSAGLCLKSGRTIAANPVVVRGTESTRCEQFSKSLLAVVTSEYFSIP